MSDRNLQNYPFKSFDTTDYFTGELVSLKAVPTRFYLFKGNGSLSIEVFKSEQSFNNAESSSPNLNKILPINSDVIKTYQKLFILIEENSLNFLQVNEDYQLEMIEIDLNALKIRVSARHKIMKNRLISDETANAEEFEKLKESYPGISLGVIEFAFEYMATNQQLAKFK